MNAYPYHKKLARALDRMGGLYEVKDILDACAAGKMQSFAEDESWAVTQVVQYPHARMLDILVAVGDLEPCRKLHDRILKYAGDNDIDFVQAYGRQGWLKDAKSRGWKVRSTSYLYQRAVT